MKRKLMNRKFLIIILVLITLLLTSFLLLKISQQPAQGEIIESNSKDSKVLVKDIQPSLLPPELIKTNCLEISQQSELSSITAVKEEIKDDFCVLRASLHQLRGQLTISVEKISEEKRTESLNEHTGVKLRKTNPEEYKEIINVEALPTTTTNTTTKDFDTAIFTTDTEITGFFLDRKNNMLTVIAIHSVPKMNEKIRAEYWKIVDSVTILL